MIFRFLNHFTLKAASLTILFLALSLSNGMAEVLDRIIAIVNDETITLSEFDEHSKDTLDWIRQSTETDADSSQVKQAREQLLANLINQKLINHEAVKANVRLSEQEFAVAYDQNMQKMNLTREEFLKKLRNSGISEKKYVGDFKAKMLRDKLILFEVRSKIVVTDEMITNYYNNEYTSSIAEGGFYILQMGFTWENEEQKAKALEKANSARQAVLDGKDFSEVARKESELPSAADGGDLGVFMKDEMSEAMRNAVVPLKSGELSEIIETRDGYQFYKLLSTQKGDVVQQVPFDSVKEEIRKKLFEEMFKNEFNEWVEGIKKRSYIKRMLYN